MPFTPPHLMTALSSSRPRTGFSRAFLRAILTGCALLAAPRAAFAQFGSGGAFESFSFIDAIALGVIIFVLFRLVSRGFGRRNPPDDQEPRQRRDNVSQFPRRNDDAGAENTDSNEPAEKEQLGEAHRRAQQTWDYLSTKPRGEQSGQQSPQDQTGRRPGASGQTPVDVDSIPDPGGPPAGVPAGGETAFGTTTSARIDVRDFDEDEFLKGAKAVYARIQESWDARDLEDIREFVGDQVYENLQQHARRNPTPSKTDILLVEAKVLEVKRDNADLTASVLYDVLLRKKGAKANSKLKEIWHFRKDAQDKKALWKVEGIQQVH